MALPVVPAGVPVVHRLGALPRADGAYRHALTLSPEYLSPLKNLAILHDGLGHQEIAIPMWRRIQELAREQGRTELEQRARARLASP